MKHLTTRHVNVLFTMLGKSRLDLNVYICVQLVVSSERTGISGLAYRAARERPGYMIWNGVSTASLLEVSTLL